MQHAKFEVLREMRVKRVKQVKKTQPPITRLRGLKFEILGFFGGVESWFWSQEFGARTTPLSHYSFKKPNDFLFFCIIHTTQQFNHA